MTEKRILVIFGDYWHAPGPQENCLKSGLEKAGIPGEWTLIAEMSRVPWNIISTFDLIIIAKEGKIPGCNDDEIWMTKEQEDAVSEYVQNGGRLFVFHNGTCPYRIPGPVRSVVKGHFLSHPPECEVTVRPVENLSLPEWGRESSSGGYAAKLQALTKDLASVTIMDEFYQLDLEESETIVFLESISPEYGRQPSGWVHPSGDGWVIGFTPGHTGRVMHNPVIQDYLSRIFRFFLG